MATLRLEANAVPKANARENVNPKMVQDTMGYASLTMTLGVYSHVQAAI